MTKRMLSLVLALCVVLGLGLPSVQAAGSDFQIDENGVLTRYEGPGGKVMIPEGVKAIGEHAFYFYESPPAITSVVIPEGVTEIREWAFFANQDLAEVRLPSTLREIKEGAFSSCPNLKSIAIPAGVVLGNACFSNSGLETVEFEDKSSVTIDPGAFLGTSWLYRGGNQEDDNQEKPETSGGGQAVQDAGAGDNHSVDRSTTIAAGNDWWAILKEDGSLWTWGYNFNCSLGQGIPDGTAADYDYEPKKILDDVVSISAGEFHGAAIKSDGSLWMWGQGVTGALGQGWSRINRDSPFHVADHVVAVSLGSDTTAMLKEDGSLWMAGNVQYGAVGNGDIHNGGGEFVKVLEDVRSVSAGRNHTAAVKSDGSLWAWGLNTDGQLGNGGKGDDETRLGYTVQSTPTKIMDNVDSVACGALNTFAVKTDGSLWGWGSNETGQLGDGTTANRSTPLRLMDGVARVATSGAAYLDDGGNSCVNAVVKTDGSLWMWGRNKNGNMGQGNWSEPMPRPVQVLDEVADVIPGSPYTLAVKDNGDLWGWGVSGTVLLSETGEWKDAKGILGEASKDGGRDLCVPAYLGISNVAVPGRVALEGASGQGEKTPAQDTPVDYSGVQPEDIPSDWAKSEVEAAILAGLVPGDIQAAYRSNITRGEFCRLLIKLVEQKTGKIADAPAANPFNDTADASVLAAHAMGIVNGTTATTFTPNGSITRQEAAAMLARTAKVLGLPAGSGETFTDQDSFASWAGEGISFVSGLTDPTTGGKVMGGTGDGRFSPAAPYSREQAVLTALRLFHIQ